MPYFKDTVINVEGNNKLRLPQVEAYLKIKEFFTSSNEREALVVLPTGTGKTGLISIAPFGICNGRVLIITPGLVTKNSVIKSLHPLEDNFWLTYDVILDPSDTPIIEEYTSDMLLDNLNQCNFIIANVQTLHKSRNNSLLNKVPRDFFDMIIVDEAHHSVATTWQDVLNYFTASKVLHVTGTPYRGDSLPLPGTIIHNTPLSEVMAQRYIKWLSKQTVNNSELYFTLPNSNQKLTIADVISLKDKEWVERSIALSPECSKEVIDMTISRLNELKSLSPKVPHKILAVACSISHAEDVAKWYQSKGVRTIIIHSDVEKYELLNRLERIETHDCDVVISVNMLVEGYDHKYLSVLGIFRPYRSLNAFAQIIGRVLRAIPLNEISDFAIDNNALVIYHEETGLDELWKTFSKEVIKSKRLTVKEYKFSDLEYQQRDELYATIETGNTITESPASYLIELDFNKLFKEARLSIESNVKTKLDQIKANSDVDDDTLNELANILRKKELSSKKVELNELILSKRPEQARKIMKTALTNTANECVQNLLIEKNIDPKSSSLYNKFKSSVPKITSTTNNDGILMMYINKKLYNRFGPVNNRTNDQLMQCDLYLKELIENLRRYL